jgi:GNAT superfamily N-acetyltransferase
VIREVEDRDFAGLAELYLDVFPWAIEDEAAVRHRHEAEPARARRRMWVADDDGRMVGRSLGSLHVYGGREDVAFVGAVVHTEHRGHGLGGELYALAERHVLALGARRLLSESVDDDAARRFAGARGFEHTMTRRLSRLDPRTFDPAELEMRRAAAEADGFELLPVSAFGDRPELVHAVDDEAVQDIPLDEPIAGLPYAEWLEEFWKQPQTSREGSFVVAHGGRPVAVTWLAVNAESGRAMNEFTGTLRAYRGRGLARLVKLAAIAWAAERDITSIMTENDESNAAMLAVNTALGYRPFAAQLSWVKDL